ncbi:MAG: OmpH family outer membrane protein [Candidatus Rokubacteria bacterium]|nr:OmpH family outer membrane protein [Candidatus Rokubacteria bacterium]
MRTVLKGFLPLWVLTGGWLAGAWWGATPGLAQSAPAARVAFVDVQRVLARSSAGVAAREQLEREKAAMQKQVDAHRGELEKLRDELEKKGQLLSGEVRKEKQDTLERKVRDVRRLVDDLQKELQKKDQDLSARVLREITAAVHRFGKEKGYAMIVDARGAAVIYGAPEADLTEEIIRVFDEESRKVRK